MFVVLVLIATACGEDEETARTTSPPAANAPSAQSPTRTAPSQRRTGTRIVVGESDFGAMLYDRRRQAIYIFENDPRGRSVCDGGCARAWPPVITRGEPQAGPGVRQSLLGTAKRADGRLQVTYAGKPLYFYANEGPGEVRCHNVDLNGGLWWVIGPNGQRRP